MAPAGTVTDSREIVGAIVPGDGRVRFCRVSDTSLTAGDWVVIDGPLGQEPGRILFDAQRVESSPSHSPVFRIQRRLSDEEIAAIESRIERAQSMIDVAKRVIAEAIRDAELASLRFTLDGAIVLCHCFGRAAEAADSLEETLCDALGVPVVLEWSDRPARSFGGLGRIGISEGGSVDAIRARLQIDAAANSQFPNGWPRLGSQVRTDRGSGHLLSVSVRHHTATVRLASGEQIEVAIDELEAPTG